MPTPKPKPKLKPVPVDQVKCFSSQYLGADDRGLRVRDGFRVRVRVGVRVLGLRKSFAAVGSRLGLQDSKWLGSQS